MLSHVTSYREFGVIGRLVFFLLGDATTLFVFIAGYLFTYLEQDRFDFRSYLWKKLRYVILPYLILSVPAIGAGIYFSRPELLDLTREAFVLWSLIVGGAVVGPMWFIPMISTYFVVSPFSNIIGRSRSVVVVAAVGLIFSIFSSRPINNLNPVLAAAHFAGFYLIGVAWAAHSAQLSGWQGRKVIRTIAIAIGIFLVAAYLYCDSDDQPLGFWDGLGRANLMQSGKLALLVALFLSFEYYWNMKNRMLAYMAEISFGLFFIHGFYMLAFSRLVRNVDLGNASTALLVEITMVVGASIVTVKLMKKVLGEKSRYVIGC